MREAVSLPNRASSDVLAMSRRKVDPVQMEQNRQQLNRRSRALAEMYLQPLFPPPEVQAEQERKYHETMDLIRNMQAGGCSYDAARRTVIGLPPYPPK